MKYSEHELLHEIEKIRESHHRGDYLLVVLAPQLVVQLFGSGVWEDNLAKKNFVKYFIKLDERIRNINHIFRTTVM
ncbi:MAG: hypothetical protein CMQ11_07660 [Gammaproteobacteria bacterium]|nr:hypothetical protein [Gammaproteobacteria bacterium]